MTSPNGSESASAAKKALRSQAVAQRANNNVDSDAVCSSLELFLSQTTGGSGQYVVVYDALEGEVNLSQIWERPAVEDGENNSSETRTISYAITRTPATDMNLTVHPVTAKLERHRWGYRQPVAGSLQVPLHKIGVVLVPGLAFDLNGGRLGWGAGYYDRFLSRLNESALKIGISDGYIVDTVPTDSHDVAMTHIATPGGVLSV